MHTTSATLPLQKNPPNPVAPTLTHQWSSSPAQTCPPQLLPLWYLHTPKVPPEYPCPGGLERNPSTATSNLDWAGLNWTGDWAGWLATLSLVCFPDTQISQSTRVPTPRLFTIVLLIPIPHTFLDLIWLNACHRRLLLLAVVQSVAPLKYFPVLPCPACISLHGPST